MAGISPLVFSEFRIHADPDPTYIKQVYFEIIQNTP